MSIWAQTKKFLGFGQEESPEAAITPNDSLINYVISLVNREDLIADQIKAYEVARKAPYPERLDAYIRVYTELEKFILANKPLVVKKEFTSESLHESLAKQVPLGKIEEPFRLLFLPENEKLFAFYNVVLGFPFKYFTDIIGKGRLLETVNKANSGTILSEADFDGEKFYLKTEAIGRLPRGKIVSAFSKLNKSLYREIASLIGKEKADLVANEVSEFVKGTYGQEFITILTQISSGFGQGRPIVTVTPAAFDMLSDIGLGRVVTEGLVKNVGGELITKGGATLPVSVTASTLQDEAGNVTGIVVAAKDMSEIQALQREKLEILEKSKVELARKVEERTKELEKANIEILKSNKRLQEVAQKLTIAQIELEKSIEEKGEFMNIAAHELRSPLQPIIGYADRMLQSGRLNDWQKERTNIILKNAKNLLQLVQDVLDINKMETGIMKFTMEEIDLLSLLKEVHESFKPTVEGKKLKSILEVPENLGKVVGDSQRLTQVFSNLIVNATKFTDAGSITIKASEEEDTFIISIIDTGIGISKKDKPKIFTKFFQADSSLNRRKRGTGLGLAICKEIIKFHKGKISVESTPGKGSVFKVVLPKNV